MHKCTLLFTLFSGCLLFSGCQAPAEINDMTIFSGAAVDYSQERDAYDICAEIINPPANETETGQNKLLYTSGKSFASAMNSCPNYTEKTVHWSHSKDLLISKELAQTVGIRPLLNFILNNNEFRLSTDLIVYENTNASSFFQDEKQNGFSQLFQVEDLLNSSEKTGNGIPMKAYEAINLINTQGIQLCLPVLAVANESPYLNGCAVFRDDRFVGQLTKEETQLLSLLQNRKNKYSLTAGNNNSTFQLTQVTTRFIPIQTSHDIQMNVEITGTALLSSYDTIPPADLSAMERSLENQLLQNCSALIQHIQTDLQSDILGAGRMIKNRYPDQWVALEKNWDQAAFTTLPFTLTCNINIQIGETHL